MRDRLVLLGVLVAAAGLGALLVFPRAREKPETPAPTTTASIEPPAPSAVPSAAPDAGPPRPPPLPDYVRINPESKAVCGEGMLLIDGIYCPYVGHSCTKFLIEERDVCEKYAPDVLCEGRLLHRRYCMDQFEYPNQEGVVPAVMVDWNDARRACAVEGKRLCTTEEWEFACEGPQMWPYPYGIDRDPTACNIDRVYTLPEMEAFSDPWKISGEVERLDKRVPSGSRPRCVSPFGVRDMTGNVDEWVENPKGKVDDKPYRSTLKGGYWGPIRARCRPQTSTHNEWFSFYQVGFRCCKDAKGSAPVEPAAREVYIPRKQRMAEPPPKPTP
ncbi:MAG: SUMF1/EgtB/PvdO family nonheme iron enzyme [Minicystis sp.]